MDWSILGCVRRGHLTFAPAEPELRAQMGARHPAGTAWQCLRCGTFVPGPPARTGPAASAPVVARGNEVRSRLVLRLFALERFGRAILAAAASAALWGYLVSRAAVQAAVNHTLPEVRDISGDLGYNLTASKLYADVQHALALSPETVALAAIAAAAYAVLELAEGTGLWLARRWGEYLAMVATSLGLPLEIYDLTRSGSPVATVLLVLNAALVVYLVYAKRLFGVRGGAAAFHARLRGESVIELARRAAAAAQPAPAPPAPAQPAPAQLATAAAAAEPEPAPPPRTLPAASPAESG